MSTIIVGAVVLIVVAAAVHKLYKDKKSGKGCSGNCSGCSGGCSMK